MTDSIQYISEEKLQSLKAELKTLREEKLHELANRIDDARQLGDLSENAEYHAAREELAWAQSRIKEILYILENAKLIPKGGTGGSTASIGAKIVVQVNGKEKEYHIVGAQEADPLNGKISNESPLGQAFLGKKKGDKVSVTVPAGVQEYEILDIHQ